MGTNDGVLEIDLTKTPITAAHEELLADIDRRGEEPEDRIAVAIHELAWSVRHAANVLGFGSASTGGRGALEIASERIARAIERVG